MRWIRSSSIAVVALYLGFADAASAYAATKKPVAAQAAAASRPKRQRVHFERPFDGKLEPLPPTALATLGPYQHVTAEQYRDLSRAAQALLRKYPADKHYFVGLGRDPAPIIAFLQNLGGKQLAVNFPASSNGQQDAGAAVFARYVKRIIPAEALASGRKIVFVDVTSSARALNHYVPLLRPHLGGARVVKAAFVSPQYPYLHENPGTVQVISTKDFPDVASYFGGIYENVIAEYPRHVPGLNAIGDLKTPLPGYKTYRDAVLQRMQRDSGLNRFLLREGGPAFAKQDA